MKEVKYLKLTEPEFPYSKIALIIQSAASLSDTTNSKPY